MSRAHENGKKPIMFTNLRKASSSWLQKNTRLKAMGVSCMVVAFGSTSLMTLANACQQNEKGAKRGKQNMVENQA